MPSGEEDSDLGPEETRDKARVETPNDFGLLSWEKGCAVAVLAVEALLAGGELWSAGVSVMSVFVWGAIFSLAT